MFSLELVSDAFSNPARLTVTRWMYYHYMGNAKKSINIFYSPNKVTYTPRYAFANWEEGNTPPKIYV